jgi:hypothetical protein
VGEKGVRRKIEGETDRIERG